MDALDLPARARSEAFERIESILDDVISRGAPAARLAHARALLRWLRASLAEDRQETES